MTADTVRFAHEGLLRLVVAVEGDLVALPSWFCVRRPRCIPSVSAGRSIHATNEYQDAGAGAATGDENVRMS